MWTLLTGIAGWIVSKFVGGSLSNILNEVVTLINQTQSSQQEKDEMIKEVTLKYLDAQVAMSATRATAWGKWSVLFAIIFAIGPSLWFNMTFLLSTFPFLFPSWYHVLALPSDFYPWLTSIIGAVFFVPVLNSAVSKIGGSTIASLFGTRNPNLFRTKNNGSD